MKLTTTSLLLLALLHSAEASNLRNGNGNSSNRNLKKKKDKKCKKGGCDTPSPTPAPVVPVPAPEPAAAADREDDYSPALETAVAVDPEAADTTDRADDGDTGPTDIGFVCRIDPDEFSRQIFTIDDSVRACGNTADCEGWVDTFSPGSEVCCLAPQCICGIADPGASSRVSCSTDYFDDGDRGENDEGDVVVVDPPTDAPVEDPIDREDDSTPGGNGRVCVIDEVGNSLHDPFMVAQSGDRVRPCATTSDCDGWSDGYRQGEACCLSPQCICGNARPGATGTVQCTGDYFTGGDGDIDVDPDTDDPTPAPVEIPTDSPVVVPFGEPPTDAPVLEATSAPVDAPTDAPVDPDRGDDTPPGVGNGRVCVIDEVGNSLHDPFMVAQSGDRVRPCATTSDCDGWSDGYRQGEACCLSPQCICGNARPGATGTVQCTGDYFTGGDEVDVDTEAPVAAPVDPPTDAPVIMATTAPVDAPTDAPVDPPIDRGGDNGGGGGEDNGAVCVIDPINNRLHEPSFVQLAGDRVRPCATTSDCDGWTDGYRQGEACCLSPQCICGNARPGASGTVQCTGDYFTGGGGDEDPIAAQTAPPIETLPPPPPGAQTEPPEDAPDRGDDSGANDPIDFIVIDEDATCEIDYENNRYQAQENGGSVVACETTADCASWIDEFEPESEVCCLSPRCICGVARPVDNQMQCTGDFFNRESIALVNAGSSSEGSSGPPLG